jgi:hypothetical protein
MYNRLPSFSNKLAKKEKFVPMTILKRKSQEYSNDENRLYQNWIIEHGA